MQSTCAFKMCFQNARYISSSNTCSNISRESRFMKKIMHVTRKTKKRWYDESTSLSFINTSLVNKSPSMHTTRRMAVRDKLFMEHITDQISMGEVSDIISRGIEITHVKITADFKCVNVFWIYSNNNASSLVTEEELQRCAKMIRHELSQLRVIGVVPLIQFVKNKQYFVEKEVEEKLAIIACEKDIEDSYSEDVQLPTSRISATNQTLQEELLSSNDSEIDEPHIQLPVMRHDVLGLDHHKIMSRITASLSKSRKAAQRHMLDTENTNADSSCNLISQKVTDFLTQEEQQRLFSDFLAKRRIEEKRKRNMKRLHERELNNIEEENEEQAEEEEIELYYENEYDIDSDGSITKHDN